MKEHIKLTESVRLDVDVLEIARQVKIHTGIPISTFIEKAIYNEAKRLPKSLKEKMAQSS